MKEVTYRWKGIKYEDLTREQMLEALRFFTKQHFDNHTPESIRHRALGAVQTLKEWR